MRVFLIVSFVFQFIGQLAFAIDLSGSLTNQKNEGLRDFLIELEGYDLVGLTSSDGSWSIIGDQVISHDINQNIFRPGFDLKVNQIHFHGWKGKNVEIRLVNSVGEIHGKRKKFKIQENHSIIDIPEVCSFRLKTRPVKQPLLSYKIL